MGLYQTSFSFTVLFIISLLSVSIGEEVSYIYVYNARNSVHVPGLKFHSTWNKIIYYAAWNLFIIECPGTH